MTETEALSIMVPPGQRRPTKWLEGVVQIHVTRACDKACFGCTQGSNLGGKTTFLSPAQFREAVLSLEGYFGVVGVFGGNPALSPHFADYCQTLRELVPFERRGLWCNHPAGKGKLMRETFNPQFSNLNVHMDREAWDEFRRDWPEAHPFGLDRDSRHSPPWVAMRDVIADEAERWQLISGCDINKYWSAMVGQFRGGLRAWFCEVAGAQSILHQDEPDYPDTGLPVAPGWWRRPMADFAHQARKHCHDCGIPLRGRGELAQAADDAGTEQTSATHQGVFRPKRRGRRIELVTTRDQLRGHVARATDYLRNS